MSQYKLLGWIIDAILVTLVLAGCAVPVVTPTPLYTSVTPTPQVVSAFTRTPSATATSTPFRFTPTPLPTPEPTTFQITSRSGSVVQVTDLGVQIGGDPGFTTLIIPTETGVEVEFNYISRVELGEKSGKSRSVTIILLDGTVLRDNLGWKADYEQSRFYGKSDSGNWEMKLADVQTIVVQRKSTSTAVPQNPPAGSDLVATLERREKLRNPNGLVNIYLEFLIGGTLTYTNGKNLQASALKFHSYCHQSGFCCFGEDKIALPTYEGEVINFAYPRVTKQLEFVREETNPVGLPVRVTAIDGKVSTLHIKETSCAPGAWRIIGETALGKLDTYVTALSRIVFDVPKK